MGKRLHEMFHAGAFGLSAGGEGLAFSETIQKENGMFVQKEECILSIEEILDKSISGFYTYLNQNRETFRSQSKPKNQSIFQTFPAKLK